MKNIVFIFAALFVAVESVQSQNMANLHQVCTNVPTKSIYVSPTGKVFYATNGASDKRVVAYDPMGNSYVTVDTGKTAYYSIEGNGTDVFIGSSTHIGKFTSNGALVTQTATSIYGIGPVYAIATNSTGVYLGSSADNVVKVNFSLVKQMTFKPSGGFGGHVTSISFDVDTMYISMDPFDGTNYWGNFSYTVNDDTVSYNTVACIFDMTTKINDVQIWNGDVYAAKSQSGLYAKNPGYCGQITTPSMCDVISLSKCGSKMWAGGACGELVDMSLYDTFNPSNYNTSVSYNMNTVALNNVDSIFDVAVDAFGEIWIATNKGVYTTATTITTDISDNINEVNIGMYPNPNNGQFTIESKESGIVYVYSVSGQNIKQMNIFEGRNEMVIDVPPGMYSVTVQTKSGNSLPKKMLVQ